MVDRGIAQFLLTCFNVERGFPRDREQRPVRTVEWLEHRFDLFERYCVPSVGAQSETRFTWLIAYDEETPPAHLARLRRHAHDAARVELVPSREAFRPPIVRRLRGRVQLVTTRLDNDDALHTDALDLVRASANGGTEYLNLTWGYAYAHPDGEARRCRDFSNPFLSLVEPWDCELPRTAMAGNHREAADFAPVRQIGDTPMWLQVIHERNVVNRLGGEACTAPDLAEFGVVAA